MNSTLRRTSYLLFALALTITVNSVQAHTIGQTYLYLGLSESRIDVRFELTPADINLALDLGLATDGTLQLQDLQRHSQAIQQYLLERLDIAPDGTRAVYVFDKHTLRDTQIAQYVLSHFVIEGLAQPSEFIDFDYGVLLDEDPNQSGVLVIENDWKSHTFANEAGVSLVFDNNSREQRLDLTGSSMLRGLMGMINLGTQHILEGFDHVLFLLAILLPAVARRQDGRWQSISNFRGALWNVAKIVTVFTIAHSITLSMAALEILNMPPRLVESIIAASIAIAALDIFYPVLGNRIVLIVFLFGLFHGAGFASVILSMDIHPDYTVWTLFGFNLGVEVGQLVIVGMLFPLLFVLRTWPVYFRYGMPAAAAFLMAISLYWFIERAFNVDLPAGEYAQRLLAFVTGV